MADAPTPLDPDEVPCPQCHADIAEVCLTPTGAKSRTIHIARRRLAAAGGVPPRTPAVDPDTPKPKRRTPKGKQFDAEAASAAGRKSAQERRRRRSEQEAAIEAAQEQALREEAERNAHALAEDAVRFARDRSILRRQTLDAASLSYSRLIEGLEHLRRPKGFDEFGRPLQMTIEVYRIKDGQRVRVVDADGTPSTQDVDEIVGYYQGRDVESLAKIAASALNSLRLEEGKATEITGQTDAAADALGQAGTAELIAFAQQHLPQEGES